LVLLHLRHRALQGGCNRVHPKRWIFLSEKKGNPKRWIFLNEKKGNPKRWIISNMDNFKCDKKNKWRHGENAQTNSAIYEAKITVKTESHPTGLRFGLGC